ncbi:Pre-rRNA-processing protein TSR2-domain-containing protein [Bombardia bombarda]|uniref:Pre-rRNA-processing protein TSR2-domain-containing protein n=1 Tax=Bombardia bombarda TaxID=252184 RepID=A0AA39X8P8_9PEZI|nr:Pre-rRNA-processing protein TSR2-domain-containing protein [Bombardia bombarda]
MATSAPSPALCQTNFEQGVALALHQWPALSLAVQNHWGGPDSSDKRDWFAGAIVDLFPDLSKLSPAQLLHLQTLQSQQTQNANNNNTSDEPEQADVETVLLQVMLDEFEVNVDDDSAYEVAETVMRVRTGCLKGRFDEVGRLRARFGDKSSKEAVEAAAKLFKKVEDQDDDTDWDTDDDEDDSEDDSDVDMGDAPAPAPPKKEKELPQVDEDGFQTVTKKRR